MKRTTLASSLFLAALLLILLSCKNKPWQQEDSRADLVKQKLTEKAQTESKGVIALVYFVKMNCTEVTAYGVHGYALDFRCSVNIKQACIKPGGMIEGWFKDFAVLTQEPTDVWDQQHYQNAKRYAANANVDLYGTANLIQRENGWEVSDITIQGIR